MPAHYTMYLRRLRLQQRRPKGMPVHAVVEQHFPVEKMSALTMDTAEMREELSKSLPVEAPKKGEGKK